MSLTSGSRLGLYEILAPIDAGGMGEVDRARDTKLGRDVAIKVVPEAFSQDPERLARFQREAHLLASLNHPNVATIHGLEESNDQQLLVMELVEGETLAERLSRGPMPIEEFPVHRRQEKQPEPSWGRRYHEAKRRAELRRTRVVAGMMAALLLGSVTATASWAFRARPQAEEVLGEVELSNVDATLVTDAMDRLLNERGSTVEELMGAIPDASLFDNHWLASVAYRLEELARREGADWPLDVKNALPARVSEARDLGPPPRLEVFERVLLQGEFQMGSESGIKDEKPLHAVSLSPYYLQKHEVSNEQYCRFDPEHICKEGPPNHPVVNVNWYDAMAYAIWVGGSLPTEAQWEFAARGKDGRVFPWGDDFEAERVQLDTNDTSPVTSHSEGATPEGVHQLAGNVWEWCLDWYGAYREEEQTDPIGPETGWSRVLRGGAFSGYYPGNQRGANRDNLDPAAQGLNIGFRVAWSAAGGQEN